MATERIKLPKKLLEGLSRPEIGAERYLVEVNLLAGAIGYQRGGTNTSYRMRTEPESTNSSHEPRAEGWLGTTDNVDRSALGLWRVVGESGTHVHLRRISEDERTPPDAVAVATARAARRALREQAAAWDAANPEPVLPAWTGSDHDDTYAAFCRAEEERDRRRDDALWGARNTVRVAEKRVIRERIDPFRDLDDPDDMEPAP